MVRRVSCILILSIAFTIMVAPGFASARNLSVANEAYSNSYTKKVIARADEKLLKKERPDGVGQGVAPSGRGSRLGNS